MNQRPAQPTAEQAAQQQRRGVVIVVVLLIVTMLSLAAYQYGDVMTAEATVAENAHRAAQVRCFADAGIHYAAAALATPDSISSVLQGNLTNNAQAFQGISITGDNGVTGKFSIICPPDPTTGDTSQCAYGVMDEGGKINIVSWMKADPTGQLLHDSLVKLPNMTEEIANNIIAWMGGSVGISNGGAGDEYYMNLKPAYRCKNGPPDSLDELLLVKGITRDLLYGADTNRNGSQDGTESTTAGSSTATTTGFDRGWSAFLTVHSREQNSDAKGNPYINLNDQDIQQLYNALIPECGDDVAKFVVMYRQYGSTLASAVNATSSQSGGSGNTNSNIGNLSDFVLDFTKNPTGTYKIPSYFTLVTAQVQVQQTMTDSNGKQTKVTVTYNSPFIDTDSQRSNLPALFKYTTLRPDAELPARVNVNTAPAEVLAALPGLSDTDVQKILQARQGGENLGDVFATPTWLLTDAQVAWKTLYNLDSAIKYPDGTYGSIITTRSQVYRVQSVGYFDGGKGPTVRVEAVIDTNAGRPRIIAWRNLSELGKGWTDPNMANNSTNTPNTTTTP